MSEPQSNLRSMRYQLAVGSRVLSMNGHDDFNQGQISCASAKPSLLIKQANCGFDEASPTDMVEIGAELGEAGPLAPPETPLHQAIYAARPEVRCIVHTHAPHATVFGATDLELRAVSHEGAYFAGNVARFTVTSHTVLDSADARAVAEALGRGSVVLLRNHGVVVVANTIRRAVVLTILLERACRLQLLAESCGKPYTVSSESDVRRKREYIYSDLAVRSYWDHAVRAARRSFAEIAGWEAR